MPSGPRRAHPIPLRMRTALASDDPCRYLVTPPTPIVADRRPSRNWLAPGPNTAPLTLGLEPESGPNRPGFQRRDQVVRQRPDTVERAKRSRPRCPAAEQAGQHAAGRRDHRGQHLLAIARTQRRAEIANTVGKPERHGFFARPIFAREQLVIGVLEPAATAFLHQRNENRMDLALDRFQP